MKKLVLFLLFCSGITHNTSFGAARKRRVEKAAEYSTATPLEVFSRHPDRHKQKLLDFIEEHKKHYEVEITPEILLDFIFCQNIGMLKIFLNEHNVNKSATVKYMYGRELFTLLGYAISLLSPTVIDLVKLLLERGADVNLKGNDSTPLSCLISKEKIVRQSESKRLNMYLLLIKDVATILYQHGANNIIDYNPEWQTTYEAQNHHYRNNVIKVMLEVPALKAFPPGLLTTHDERRPLLDEYLFE